MVTHNDYDIHLPGLLGSLSIVRKCEEFDPNFIGFCFNNILNFSLKESNF